MGGLFESVPLAWASFHHKLEGFSGTFRHDWGTLSGMKERNSDLWNVQLLRHEKFRKFPLKFETESILCEKKFDPLWWLCKQHSKILPGLAMWCDAILRFIEFTRIFSQSKKSSENLGIVCNAISNTKQRCVYYDCMQNRCRFVWTILFTRNESCFQAIDRTRQLDTTLHTNADKTKFNRKKHNVQATGATQFVFVHVYKQCYS